MNENTSAPFEIVGFDMDGTLLDTSGDLAAAVNHALESAGRPPLPVATIRTMIGGGARHMLAQGMAATGGCTDAELDVLHRRLLDFYEANMVVETAPFPHALAALDKLAARGATLAIVTNKIERYAVEVLATLGLSERFACVIGGDTLPVGKPDPAPIRAMIERCGGGTAAFVGDSIYDVEAAHAAGLPVVASDLPVFREYLTDGHDALLPPVADPVALAAAMTRVVRDAGLRDRLRSAGHATAARFTWQRSAEIHTAIYDGLHVPA